MAAIRTVLKEGSYRTFALWASLRNAVEPPGLCLMYHRIGDPTGDTEGLTVPTRVFEQQVQQLAQHHQVVPFRDLCHTGGERIAITFDDGYRDNATIAADILARHGLPATFFVTTGFVQGLIDPWWDALADMLKALDQIGTAELDPSKGITAGHLRRDLAHAWSIGTCATHRRMQPDPTSAADARRAFMTEADLANLARNTLFDIGAHSITHRRLPDLTTAEQFAELALPREVLGRMAGTDIDLLAYPYGAHDAATMRLAAACGYRQAATTRPGQVWEGCPPLEIPRHAVPALEGKAFAQWLDHCRVRHAPRRLQRALS